MVAEINFPAGLTLKEITVREVFDALEKNGLEWLRGRWFKNGLDSDGEIKTIGGCVLGQAAANLGVVGPTESRTDSLAHYLTEIGYSESDWWHVSPEDTAYSILNKYSLEDQLNQFTTSDETMDDLTEIIPNVVFGSRGLASVIIECNDRKDPNTGQFYIKTYKEVVDIARQLMEPYFGEYIQVLAINREAGVQNANDFSV